MYCCEICSNNNEKYFTEEVTNDAADDSDDPYPDPDEDDYQIVGSKMDINDYANIAMTARYTFSERSFICPCHKSNEYYFNLHNVHQPDNWCSPKKRHFDNLKNLCAHLKRKAQNCDWHLIYSVYFDSYLEQEDKRER